MIFILNEQIMFDILKEKRSLMIFVKYPEIGNKWDRSFWARGYYVSSLGNITEDAIKRYIQEQ